MNEELRRIWEESSGHDPHAARQFAEVEKKLANIRQAVEDGLGDAAWANARLRALLAEREKLQEAAVVSGDPPQIDVETALA